MNAQITLITSKHQIYPQTSNVHVPFQIHVDELVLHNLCTCLFLSNEKEETHMPKIKVIWYSKRLPASVE